MNAPSFGEAPDLRFGASAALPRYRPVAQIGRGRTVEVILAEMRMGPGLSKLAVLRRLWPDLSTDAELTSMFVNEARLGARMNHPNVAQIYELLVEQERPTVAMEYLDGQPLGRVLNRLAASQSLSLSLRLRIVANVLAALEHAHELTGEDGAPEGVIHQDVNPQNVFLTYTGQVKLLNFGLARNTAAAYQIRPGSVKSKLAYTAPEQLTGAPVDRRADLFAAGVMLWELAVGRRLWQGMTEASVIRQLSSRVPAPPLGGDSGLPRGLEKICARALARDAANRYSTATEFCRDLQRLISGNSDAQARQLGQVVGLAFAADREARRALIQSHMRRGETSRPASRRPVPGGTGGRQSLDELPVHELEDLQEVAPPNPGRPRFGRITQLVVPASRRPSRRQATTGLLAVVMLALLFAGAPVLWRDRSSTAATAAPNGARPAVTRASSGFVVAPLSPATTTATVAPPPSAPAAPPLVPDAAPAPSEGTSEPRRTRGVQARLDAQLIRGDRDRRRFRLTGAQPERVISTSTPVTDEDDVLRPSIDLSEVQSPVPASATVPPIAPPVVDTPASPAAPTRLARRVGPRPLDVTFPFQP